MILIQDGISIAALAIGTTALPFFQILQKIEANLINRQRVARAPLGNQLAGASREQPAASRPSQTEPMIDVGLNFPRRQWSKRYESNLNCKL
jgi:hypothetical protein